MSWDEVGIEGKAELIALGPLIDEKGQSYIPLSTFPLGKGDKSESKFIRAKNDKEVFVELKNHWRSLEIPIEIKPINNITLNALPIFIIACIIFLDFPITIGETIQQTFLTSL